MGREEALARRPTGCPRTRSPELPPPVSSPCSAASPPGYLSSSPEPPPGLPSPPPPDPFQLSPSQASLTPFPPRQGRLSPAVPAWPFPAPPAPLSLPPAPLTGASSGVSAAPPLRPSRGARRRLLPLDPSPGAGLPGSGGAGVLRGGDSPSFSGGSFSALPGVGASVPWLPSSWQTGEGAGGGRVPGSGPAARPRPQLTSSTMVNWLER